MGSPGGFSFDPMQMPVPAVPPARSPAEEVMGPPPAAGAARLRTLARVRYAITALVVGVLALGLFWRLYGLGYPTTFSFDEHHFVENARNYMNRQADWNDHPPLGKLLLLPSMSLFGDNGLGWRLGPALLGLALIALAGFNASKIFGDRRVGLLTAAFVAMDGFFISYARVALLDTPMTLFIYAALALMLCGPSLYLFAGAAIFVGLAVATKWTGVCILLIAPWLLWRQRRSPGHVIWMFAVASLVYLAISAAALYLTRQPLSLERMLKSNVTLLKHHAGFTEWDNAASSPWYSWPVLAHPIVMFYKEVAPGQVRATTTLGNVLLWYATTAALAWTLTVSGRALWRARRSFEALKRIVDSPGIFAVATMVALILPFMVTNRQSYIFHYLGAYGVGLGLLAAMLVRAEARFPRALLGFLATAAVFSVVYVPLWTNALVSRGGFLARLPFPGWR